MHGQLQPCRTCFQKNLERSNQYARRYNASNSRNAEGMSRIVIRSKEIVNWQMSLKKKKKKNATSHWIIFLLIYKILRRKITIVFRFKSTNKRKKMCTECFINLEFTENAKVPSSETRTHWHSVVVLKLAKVSWKCTMIHQNRRQEKNLELTLFPC